MLSQSAHPLLTGRNLQGRASAPYILLLFLITEAPARPTEHEEFSLWWTGRPA